jgi:hypothetical protein
MTIIAKLLIIDFFCLGPNDWIEIWLLLEELCVGGISISCGNYSVLTNALISLYFLLE